MIHPSGQMLYVAWHRPVCSLNLAIRLSETVDPNKLEFPLESHLGRGKDWSLVRDLTLAETA